MSEPGEPGEDRTWIVQPPEPGEISLYLSFGDGVRLTSEQEEAINGLIRALETADAEVTGFAPKCTKLGVCAKLTCTPVNCVHLSCGTFRTASAMTDGAWNLMGTFGDGSL
jgi:hypothetical protein